MAGNQSANYNQPRGRRSVHGLFELGESDAINTFVNWA
jgi:hypothetical protein